MYFGAFHKRVNYLYDCSCNECKHQPEEITLSLKTKFKALLKTVEKAFKALHTKGSYTPADLVKMREYRDIIRETNGILSSSLENNKMSKKMKDALQKDIFYFSQLKTNAQLFEASRLLLTKDGKLKSFEIFSKEVASIKSNYNENYLEAEHDFAVGSVQMAERWDNFEGGEKFLLQYRTAQDDRVRDEHAALEGITLPKEDAFWDQYFPPNGWRCRCTTVEVLARRYKPSNREQAMKKGERATHQEGKDGKNKLEIFRFNPGKQGVVFPPSHPYSKIQGAKEIKK